MLITVHKYGGGYKCITTDSILIKQAAVGKFIRRFIEIYKADTHLNSRT